MGTETPRLTRTKRISARPPSTAKLIRCAGGLDCSQGYHRLWLPDCSGRKTEQCAERRGEPSRGFGVDRPAGHRFEQGRNGDRAVHSPSPCLRSQPKCPRLRYRSERASSLTPFRQRAREQATPLCGDNLLPQVSSLKQVSV